MITAIINASIFDGERVIDDRTVVIEGATIRAVGGVAPAGASVFDAHGATLMPGLIDAHVHTETAAELSKVPELPGLPGV